MLVVWSRALGGSLEGYQRGFDLPIAGLSDE